MYGSVDNLSPPPDASALDDHMFRSPPPPRPNFFDDAPLSTKREKMKTASMRSRMHAPRVTRTAPTLRAFPHRFNLKPIQLSFKPTPDNDMFANSSVYDPKVPESYFDQAFVNVNQLGDGSFGDVFHVISRDDGRHYAVKRSKEPYRTTGDRKNKLREVQNHELMPPHMNIVGFVKAWEERGRLYIQTELCETSLSQYMAEKDSVPEKQIWDFFIDVLMAVDHMHSNHLLHLDIKLENILLTHDGICKLGDFGLVFDLRKDSLAMKEPEEGDCKYLAPEVLNGKSTAASDIFSFGISMLELATDLDLPSQGKGWQDVRTGNIPERFFNGVSSELRRVIMWMMSPDPTARPTTKDLLADSSIRRRLLKRGLTVRMHEWKTSCVRCIGVMALWLTAFLHILVSPLVSFMDALRKTKTKVCSTPYASRANFYKEHTPEVSAMNMDMRRFNQIQNDMGDVSDDEYDDPVPRRHAQSLAAMRHRSVLGGQFDCSPLSPMPVSRLNFDDDTNSSSSSPSPSPPPALSLSAAVAARSETPSEERLPDANLSPMVRRRHPMSESRPSYRREMASGDWMDDSDAFEAPPSIDRLYNNNKANGLASCPQMRPPMRTRIRERRPLPRLDFSILDKDRRVEDRGSSADEL